MTQPCSCTRHQGEGMTETRSIYTAHDPSDLLDLLPMLFGFQPEDSLVAVATHGPKRRFGFRLRMDIPAPEYVEVAAQQAADYLMHQEPDGVILIAVSGDGLVADELMDRVGNLLDVPVHEAVRTDGDRYWSLGGPPEGEPYVSSCSPAVAGAVLEGMQILPDREALVQRFAAVEGDRKEAMEKATHEVLGTVLRELAESPRIDLKAVGNERLAPIFERHARAEHLGDKELATLAIWVSSTSVRDDVWMKMRRDSADADLELWTRVAQSVVEPFEPPVLSLAAFAAWLSGDGTQALIAAERAVEIQPGYSMAGLVLQALDVCMSPEAWDGFDTDASCAGGLSLP